MQYWVMKDGVQYGPLNIDELKATGINPETYVWFEGMDDWAQAKNIVDLRPLLNGQEAEIIQEPTVSQSVDETDVIATTANAPEVQIEEREPAEEAPAAEEESVAEEQPEEVVEEKEEPQAPPVPTPEAPSYQNPYCGQPQYQYNPQPYYAQPQQEAQKPKCPPTYLALSIVLMILCCQVTGIVAIIYSANVSSKYNAGDYEGAQKYSDRAALWCILSIVLGLISVPFAILFQLIVAL